MSESNARLLLSILGVSAVIGYVIAIIFGAQGHQSLALIFFVVSLVDTVTTFFVYRYYAGLRGARWQDEVKATEDKMQQLFAEEAGTPEQDRELERESVKRE